MTTFSAFSYTSVARACLTITPQTVKLVKVRHLGTRMGAFVVIIQKERERRQFLFFRFCYFISRLSQRQSSVVDLTIDEILTELGNESEVHSGSVLLLLPIDKQEFFPSHSNVPFKPLSLICHKKEQEQRREEICTTKDLSESFKEFMSGKLISPEDGRLPRSSTIDRVT